MMRLKYRITGLILVFVLALLAWIGLFQRDRSNPAGLKSSRLAEASLPVLWAESCGRRMDVMRGRLAEEHADPAYDTLIILPEDRKLKLYAEEGRLTVTGIRYEIRSADGSDLIERTEVTDREQTEKGFSFVLPIQNLLSRDRQYSLELVLNTAEKGEARYYGRIAFDSTGLAGEMLSLAEQFSVRNFDYNTARENTAFLETNETGDNTTLARVDLKASFSQLTYGPLSLTPMGEADLRLLEYNGSMGVIRRRFLASGDGEDGDQMMFEICEDFVMRKGPERIYMMDYTRTMEEVFLGDTGSVADGKIILGVGSEDAVQMLQAPEGRFSAFVSAGDLWLADGDENTLVRVWSFRSGTDSGLRSGFEKHGIRLLSLSDDGSLYYLLYGYMNRGAREGLTGVSLMRYGRKENSVEELLFLPSQKGFERLEQEVRTLSHLGENGMLYLTLNGAAVGIDITSGDSILISSRMESGSFAVSADQTRLAFVNSPGTFGGPSVCVMNLDTGEQKTLEGAGGQLLRPVGFIGSDLAVGVSDPGNTWILNGKERELPFSAVEIVDDSLVSQAHYAAEGLLYTDVRLKDERIHLTRLRPSGEHSYTAAGTDTIVCNEKTGELPVTPSFVTEQRETTWYVPVPKGLRERGLRTLAPESLVTESAKVLTVAGQEAEEDLYSAYGRGKLTAESRSFGEAIGSAYEGMGYVRHGGEIVYCRAATSSIRTLRNPDVQAPRILAAREEDRVRDLYGAPFRAALYFVSRGSQVLGWTEQGAPLIIYAYDQTGVSLYSAADGNWLRVTMQEAEDLFDAGRRDFCALLQ